MTFSERNGYATRRLQYQGEAMDQPLRNHLWNTICTWYFEPRAPQDLPHSVWRDYLFQPVDLFNLAEARDLAREVMTDGPWAQAYDLVEYVTTFVDEQATASPFLYDPKPFIDAINEILDKHMAGWRILRGQVVPITAEMESDSVDDALTAVDANHAGASHHLRAAVSALSDRTDPDYANSIRESFLAVEGVAKAIVGDRKKTLGEAIGIIKRRTSAIDAGVLQGWSAMYGRASDADGLRHAGPLAPVFNAADARYMLVTASAFINLLLTYDTHNAAVDYVPESEIPPWERPGFEASTPDPETPLPNTGVIA